MSKVDKESVFQTTKVRTKLKGDGSWMQRRNEAQDEDDKAKPWLAEVRASRENGAPVETSPVSSPTTPTPPPTKPDAERGIFTKLDKTPSSSTTNSVGAPYTVRPTLESQEDQLSTEEQEKRTEAASSVVRQSAARQRSYVLSAAKKFDIYGGFYRNCVLKNLRSSDTAPDTSLVNSSPSFVARRVQITDDDESAVSPAPASTPAPSPVAPATSVAPAPETKPWKLRGTSVKTAVDVAVNEPVAPKVEDAAPEPVKDDPPLVIVKDPFEGMKPGCTKVDTPLPILLPDLVQTVCAEPEPEKTDVSGKVNIPLVKLTPASPIKYHLLQPPLPRLLLSQCLLQQRSNSGVDKLTALSDTLISFDTSSTSSKDDERVLAEKEQGPGDSPTAEDGDDKEPAPELINCIHMTDDLLVLTNGPEESAEPVPPSPGRWSQDLLSGLDSLSTQREEEKQTDETPKVTQSSTTETVTVTTKTVIITDKSLPFTSMENKDPSPETSQEEKADPWSSHVTTTVTNSSVLHSPMENNDQSPKTNNALESLADNVIPISTDTTSLSSHRSWARTWETSTPQQANTEESQEAVPGGQTVDQETLVKFEKKSKENDSPWDRWTSPTVYTITTERDDDEERRRRRRRRRGRRRRMRETVTTTITTIRETHSEQQPVIDRYETYSNTVMEEDPRVQTPEPEAKKGFVYVKEYVNATEMSMHNASDNTDTGSDYLTSSSTSHSYSSPSSGSLSSACTFCGELVGSDAKITIDHLNINCHPHCFKCGVCNKYMGDLLDSMFLHGGKVHCETCYSKALD
ncbi:hypothetical protein F7725_009928 [Dissostichus mawsoni]|uniref:LIM zinc-binding domain-containing protein n=1 Tax=Dissostichus mawsoni TaxID=36200 RepID=A0A7J5XMD6_DISMA|nr:hypothetical protein F7725_009928 [Dissostichus mawsoni]